MSTPFNIRPVPAPPERQGLPAWLRYGLIGGLVLTTSLLLAHQIVSPDVRTMQILLAGVLLVAALKVSSFTTLLFIALAIPTYKPTTYGGTTLAFVLVLFILWMVRLSLKLEKSAGRSPIDIPVAAFLFAYLLSFSQIEHAEGVREGVFNFFTLITQVCVAYMTLHLTRTVKQLRTLIGALVVMAVLIDLTAVFELAFPGSALIPGWMNLGAEWAGEYARKGMEIKGLRVAGVFFDYELLAEFCALSMLLFWFLFTRAQKTAHRVGIAALLALNTFVLFSTVTRGAIVSLMVAGLYLMLGAAPPHSPARARHRTRHRFRFRLVHPGLCGPSHEIREYPRALREDGVQGRGAGNARRRVETGVGAHSPEARVRHGPYYAVQVAGVDKILWPHNNYLFLWHMIGIVGLGIFLWILWTLWDSHEDMHPVSTIPTSPERGF